MDFSFPCYTHILVSDECDPFGSAELLKYEYVDVLMGPVLFQG